MKAAKQPKYKQAHTDNVKMGMGDYYGTGITAKIGRMRDGMGFQEISPKKLKTPPKSLA
jgi:hypothetical protein